MSASAPESRPNNSTNGRLIPMIAGLASRLAPQATARWAERVFLTPGRRVTRPAEARIMAAGHFSRVPFAHGRLAAWSWGDGPTVFLAHGWGSSAARMTSFVDPLVQAGFSVVAFDGPGHGQSDGRTSSVIELTAALRAVMEWAAAADAGAVHAGAIGHSIGGVAIARAAKQGVRFRRAVFIGTPAGLETPSYEFLARLGLSPAVGERMRRNIEGRFGVAWRDLDVTRTVPQDPFPLLVVHDAGDGAVPVEESARIAAAWPGAERVVTEGLGHHRIVHDPEVVARVVAFVTGGGASVPARTTRSEPRGKAAGRVLAGDRR